MWYISSIVREDVNRKERDWISTKEETGIRLPRDKGGSDPKEIFIVLWNERGWRERRKRYRDFNIEKVH